jgi:hypothetical protein
VIDRIIRATTALAMVGVAVVAAIISYRHAYELVRSHGESGTTARLVPLTVDGLIWAASMVILDSNRRTRPVPPLAGWSLGVGVVATVGANMAHGMGHGVIGLLVSAWPALALVGAYELLMTLIRAEHAASVEPAPEDVEIPAAPAADAEARPEPESAPTLEQLVRARYEVGASQRSIARDLNIDRRKVKSIIEQPA